MKILTILNDDTKQDQVALIKELQVGNEVEIVSLAEDACNYEELVEKIEQCDKVISW